MVLAERIPNSLLVDIRERLERLHDRRANAPSRVEGAMRLTASRNLPDAIIGHQRQCAIDVVEIPRFQKAIDKWHSGSSRSLASSHRGTAPAPTNSAMACVTAS